MPINPVINDLSGDANARSTVNSAISLINSAYGQLTTPGQNAVSSVTTIEIDPSGAGRSWMDVTSGTFHLSVDDVRLESVNYVAADILHDGYHVVQYLSGTASSGIQAEQNAVEEELLNATALGLNPTETQFLHDYMNDSGMIQARIDEPVSSSDGSGSLDLGLFTFVIESQANPADLYGSDLDTLFTFGMGDIDFDTIFGTGPEERSITGI